VTIALGLLFIIFQGLEYYESTYDISDSIYSGAFFMLTGLHGCHVIVGVGFLTVCFIRLFKNHYLINHYLGLVMAI
jgi:cytochrome c oxidase subunit III